MGMGAWGARGLGSRRRARALLVQQREAGGGVGGGVRHEEQQQRLGALLLVVDARRGDTCWQRAVDGGDQVLDLVAVEVGATDDDHLLVSARQREPAFVHEAEVARVEPTVG